jgi:hypothetical protein
VAGGIESEVLLVFVLTGMDGAYKIAKVLDITTARCYDAFA